MELFFKFIQPSRHQWQIVFYISSAIYMTGALVYLIFASGEEQPWASSERLSAKRVSIAASELCILKAKNPQTFDAYE